MERPSDLIQSVSRALRILEVVGSEPTGASPKVVARRCELSLSTTYHLLRTLCYEGYLVRLPSGDYVVGLEIADRFRDLRTALARSPQVRAVLQLLAARTGRSAYLARFVDGRVAIAEVAEAPGSPHLEDLVPGFDEAAHATALGKALLATMTPAQRRAYLAEAGLRPFTAATVRGPDDLEAELADAAGGVYAETCQYRDGVACMAALVFTDVPEDPWWALAIGGSADDVERDRPGLRRLLQSAAADLGS
jgi:DNA-binding IclR family transcriptional regulator